MRPRAALPAGIAVTVGLLCAASVPLAAQEGRVYRRADANLNGSVDISDAIFVLSFLFTGGPAPACRATADANGSGEVDISDAVTILNYLFVNPVELPPLTDEERLACERQPPPPPSVVRHGTLRPLAHEVAGKVEQLSNRKIRIASFYYDGSGLPEVVVWLYKTSNEDFRGYRISEDLRRLEPYVNETLEYDIPPEITDDMFNYVSIWCTWFPQNYGYARLFLGS
ncbi:MAG: DM13 domain-containing protein [Planctomycetes bacterium]|nr:DM13 domain-containing protein [Planctomycetota bacterium]